MHKRTYRIKELGQTATVTQVKLRGGPALQVKFADGWTKTFPIDGAHRVQPEYAVEFAVLARKRGEQSEEQAEENPLSEEHGSMLLGVTLLVVAASAAKALYSSSQAQANVVGFTPADTNTTTPVSVGNILSFALPLSAAGQSWQAVLNDPSNVIGVNPTTLMVGSQETDNYRVIGPGSATVGYQLFDVSNNAVGSPLKFEITAT